MRVALDGFLGVTTCVEVVALATSFSMFLVATELASSGAAGVSFALTGGEKNGTGRSLDLLQAVGCRGRVRHFVLPSRGSKMWL